MPPELVNAFRLLLGQLVQQQRDQAQLLGYAETQTQLFVLDALHSLREALAGTVPELDALIGEAEQAHGVGS